MLYSIYSKWIKEDLNINFDEEKIYKDWITVGANLPPSEVMDILEVCREGIYANEYIEIVLPEICIGNKVLNIKNNQIGIVTYFDQDPTELFDNVELDENGLLISKNYEYATIQSENETLNWEIKDLIVLE